MILQQDRDVVAAFESEGAEQLGALVRRSLEVSVSERLASVRHDVSDLVGIPIGDDARVHVLSSPRCDAGWIQKFRPPFGPGQQS
jgi:hypothetical protein